MSKELFPIVKFTEEAFLKYAEKRFPLSRERALRRAIEQRCIIVGKLPTAASLLECNREAFLHLSPETNPPSEQITDLDKWEDSCLGRPFESAVLKQGDNVLETLRPALLSNSVVQVIDPYLVPYCRRRIRTKGLLYLVSPPAKIRAINAITKLFDRNQPHGGQSSDDFSPEKRATDIARWLAEKLQEPLNVKILLHERIPRNSPHVLHDRFIGFSSSPNVDTAWHALSIGYGLAALTQERQTLTCLARVTAKHFLDTWNAAEEGCTWQILRNSDRKLDSCQWEFIKEYKGIAIYHRPGPRVS
ncbi:MAG: hypothetical protein WC314_14780 [Vulcanimicrobiota bacterium]